MIKEGDTVFCIKSFSTIGQKFYKGKAYQIDDYTENYGIIEFYKGKAYQIDDYTENYGIIEFYIKGEVTNTRGGGYWFRLNGAIIHRNKFSDYFMTIAEWRERQINSILDE